MHLENVVSAKRSTFCTKYGTKPNMYIASIWKTYLLCHLTITIAHKNSLLKIRYTYYANLVEVYFTNFA